MQLTRDEEAMLEGRQGPAKKKAMEGLLQLGRAFGAPRLVEIGYAHVHAGMALYLEDVELMEALAGRGRHDGRARLRQHRQRRHRPTGSRPARRRSWSGCSSRAESAHQRMGSACTFTCTPYWAGHWPTWNTHMTSIESTVTIFCNSVLGAKSNRDGFFAVYAAITGRYPLFGYHLDENRRGTHLFHVDAALDRHHRLQLPRLPHRQDRRRRRAGGDGAASGPTLDELDALGAGMATSGGVALFIVPRRDAALRERRAGLRGAAVPEAMPVARADIDAVYAHFCTGRDGAFDIVHVGCPHASFEEMKDYANLLDGKKVADNVEFWITTSRTVRRMAEEAGLLTHHRGLRRQGDLRHLPDLLPFRAHDLARPGARRRAAADPHRGRRLSQAGEIRARHDPVRHAADRHRGSGRDGDHRPLRAARRREPDRIAARGIVDGKAAGPALVGAEPVSFLGDVDIRSGRDRRRPAERCATPRSAAPC